MSTLTNTLEIQAIKADLEKKITFEQMTNAQKRAVVDQLFPLGVALWYLDPKAAVGDKIFGWGDPAINSGGFFFGQLTALPASNANISFKFQS